MSKTHAEPSPNGPSFDEPWRLAPDNFTPPVRTPWGGQRILAMKRGLGLAPDKAAYTAVGEAWEVSVDAGFPSGIVGADLSLARAIAKDPLAALGPGRKEDGLSILVKLIDAQDKLSVQVHPAEGEDSKVEAWFVLAAEPGAGIYLGFEAGVTPAQVREALAAGRELPLDFVAVAPGDVFEIAPGTVHAIGGGVTLCEPQCVRPGKHGATLRLWDWNRRYDARGRLDPHGEPRALHVEEGLAVADFSRGVSQARKTPMVAIAQAARRDRSIAHSHFVVDVLSGTGTLAAASDALQAVVVVAGCVVVESARAQHRFEAGESFVLPQRAAATCRFQLHAARAIVSEPR